jgi:hypothetical protein
MTLILSGTDGLSDVDGSAATPAIRGTDANTGIFFPAADTIAFSEGGVEAMRIDSSGNVGIGQSANLTSKLTVKNSITFDRYGDATEGLTISTNSGNAVYNTFGGLNHVLQTAGTERARIDTSGNFLVGTAGNGRNGLVVYYVDKDVINSHSNVASGSTYSLYTGWHSATSTTGGTLSFNVTTNGNVTNTNNSYGPISDVKLKENIVDATPKLQDLMQVRIVNYNLKAELGYESHKQIGVVAQELEQVFAGLVDEMPDKDAEGNDLGTTTKSVKMSVFTPILIKAIQEQQAIITQLQADVAALKGTA